MAKNSPKGDQIPWLREELATQWWVQRAFKHLTSRQRRDPGFLDALSRLTWISKSQGKVSDKRFETISKPALCKVFGIPINAYSRSALLVKAGTDGDIPGLHGRKQIPEIGFVNPYNAYRNSFKRWLRRADVRLKLPLIYERAFTLRNDEEALEVFRELLSLPNIPRSGGGNAGYPAYKWLTPVVACLDPRMRFPIINEAAHIKELLAYLERQSATPEMKFETLLDLMEQNGITAFKLDVLGIDVAKKTIKILKQKAVRARTYTLKDALDIRDIASGGKKRMVRLHNAMTNAFRSLVGKQALHEATGNLFRFDLLYQPKNKNAVLIEVKSSVDAGAIRLAVGQLLDYRRSPAVPRNVRLAVLLPRRPESSQREFLRSVGVDLIYFQDKYLNEMVGL